MDETPITMTEGCLYHDTNVIKKRLMAKAKADHEREKQKLEEIMEEAHKAGRKPFDLMEFLDYYRCYFNMLPSKEDVLSGKVSDDAFSLYKWQYYISFPEMESAKDLAIYYNQLEMNGMY